MTVTQRLTVHSRRRISFAIAALLAALNFSQAEENADERASLIVVAGVAGEAEYGEAFADWAEGWKKAVAAGDARTTAIGSDDTESLEHLRSALQHEPTKGAAPLWLVLLGHGTFNGHDAKFNLRGADLDTTELAKLLKPIERPVIVIAAFSSSGAFLAPLAAPGRIVLTATKSGSENNFSRFGKYLSRAIADPAADLDHDGQTSLLEAWLSAAKQTAEFYKSEGRLATEHSLLDDNGDGHGTPADWFEGIRVAKKPRDNSAPDGLRARQLHLVPSAAERALPAAARAERDSLEMDLARLRDAKAAMKEDAYFGELEKILVRLARIYGGAEKSPRASPAADSGSGKRD